MRVAGRTRQLNWLPRRQVATCPECVWDSRVGGRASRRRTNADDCLGRNRSTTTTAQSAQRRASSCVTDDDTTRAIRSNSGRLGLLKNAKPENAGSNVRGRDNSVTSVNVVNDL